MSSTPSLTSLTNRHQVKPTLHILLRIDTKLAACMADDNLPFPGPMLRHYLGTVLPGSCEAVASATKEPTVTR